MPESTLSITYADIKQAVAHYLGLSLSASDWSVDDVTMIDMIVKRGLRKFYKPQPIFQGEPPHRWSFLNPTTTLTTIPSYTTGTIALVVGSANVTLTDGVWPSWAETNGSIVIDNVVYAIASRTNNTVIVLAEAWAGAASAATTFELRHNGLYDMPASFAGMASRTLSHEPGVLKPHVKLVSEAQIRKMLAHGHTGRSWPQYCAVRPKNTAVTATAGQRFEMMFYPIPDMAYVLSYAMTVQVDMLSDESAYPLGGGAHGETIIAACIAVAELSEDNIAGPREADYIKLLASSIREDQVAFQSEHLGYNGDRSDDAHNFLEVRTLSGLVRYEPD